MRILATSALLAIAGTLSACAGGPVNQGLTPINQPVVSRADYVFDVNAGGDTLSYSEQARIADWFETIELGYGDRVSIDDPSPYGNAGRRQAVAEIAGRYGLLLADRAPVTAGQIAPGQMRVVVSRMHAEVPNCPNWDRDSLWNYAGSTGSNYGCSTNGNLAAMVANPEDLVRGQRGDGTIDPRTTSRAIDSYRDATPTGAGNGLQQEATTTGGN
ncbi:MAG: CpaD family pilus assembly protein [Parasphingopyxis sp.]|uniref:CpaD family pilus assembly protein n=1 Tax=Parasphingopyxis sp. TaxID=1920299 RepID=UPI003F9F30F8